MKKYPAMTFELCNKRGYLNAFALSFFMLSGLLKSFIQFISEPFIDITLLSASLLLACFLFNFKDRNIINRNFLSVLYAFFAFTILIFLSLLYTESESYGYVKAFLWLTCLLGFSFPLFNYINVRFFSYIIITVSLLLSVVHSLMFSFLDLSLLPAELKYVVFGVYLDLGYFLGLSIFLCIFIHSYSVRSYERYFIFLLGVLAFFMLFSSGARGPFLFTTILLIFWIFRSLFSGIKFKKKSLVVIYLFSCLAVLAVLFKFTFGAEHEAAMGKQIERSVYRLSLIFNDDRGDSINTRVHHFDESLYHIDLNPYVGYGFGSYGIVTTGVDQKAFPHNMFLETWFELGLLGLLVLIIFTLMSLSISFVYPSLFFLNLFIIANQMKSSNLSDSRVYFSIIGVIFFIAMFNSVKRIK